MAMQLDLLDALAATLPSRVSLTRIDPTKRMARFYVLAIEPTLFGQYALVREFGRMGRGGRIMSEFYDTASEAVSQFERQLRVKVRRGYASPSGLAQMQ